MKKRPLTLGLSILALSTLAISAPRLWASSPPPSSASCSQLEIIPVVPDEPWPELEVDCQRAHSQECRIKKGFAQFAREKLPDGGFALKVKRLVPSLATRALRKAGPTSRKYLAPLVGMEDQYLEVLRQSPLIAEMARLRITARSMSGQTPPCEPLLFYLGSDELFGTGPVFVDGYRFMLEGKVYHNFIAGEDAKHPLFPTADAISKASLVNEGYFDTVISHELAHGLMQDLYGIEAMKKLEDSHMVSTVGHFEGAITDPATAWVEGFAEGFEAYLAEKYVRADALRSTPHLDGLVKSGTDRLDMWDNKQYVRYIFGIPVALFGMYKNLLTTDDVISDWLKLHRQAPIRIGEYLFRGPFSAFGHHYNIFISNPLRPTPDSEYEDIQNGTVDNTEAIYSKEGVVAFLVYRMLKSGLTAPLLETMNASHPGNLYELVTALLPRLNEDQLRMIYPDLTVVFDPEARKSYGEGMASADVIPAKDPDVEKKFENYLAAAREDLSKLHRGLDNLRPPRDLWVEFETPSEVMWWMDFFERGNVNRLNFATASFTQIQDFVQTIRGIPPESYGVMIAGIQQILEEHPEITTVDELVRHFTNSMRHQTNPAIRKWVPWTDIVERAIAGARKCFLRRCSSSG